MEKGTGLIANLTMFFFLLVAFCAFISAGSVGNRAGQFEAEQGQSVALTCPVSSASMRSSTTVFWKRNGRIVEEELRKYIFLKANKTLVILNVATTDGGGYWCVIANEAGWRRAELLHLTVRPLECPLYSKMPCGLHPAAEVHLAFVPKGNCRHLNAIQCSPEKDLDYKIARRFQCTNVTDLAASADILKQFSPAAQSRGAFMDDYIGGPPVDASTTKTAAAAASTSTPSTALPTTSASASASTPTPTSATTPMPTPNYSSKWAHNPNFGFYYKIFNSGPDHGYTFAQAQNMCVAEGAHLASLRDHEEHMFVNHVLVQPAAEVARVVGLHQAYWIGLLLDYTKVSNRHKQDANKLMKWIDGSALTDKWPFYYVVQRDGKLWPWATWAPRYQGRTTVCTLMFGFNQTSEPPLSYGHWASYVCDRTTFVDQERVHVVPRLGFVCKKKYREKRIEDGAEIKLFSVHADKYIYAYASGWVGPWEKSSPGGLDTFTVGRNTDGSVSFRAHSSRFVGVDPNDGGRLHAKADVIGDWERFYVEELETGNFHNITLKCKANNNYVRVDKRGLMAYTQLFADADFRRVEGVFKVL